jgi:hypothetical protein
MIGSHRQEALEHPARLHRSIRGLTGPSAGAVQLFSFSLVEIRMKSTLRSSTAAAAILVTFVSFGVAALPSNRLKADSTLNHDVVAAMAIGKNYNVGAMLSMAGNVNTQVSNPDRTVIATVDRIRNDSLTVTSGPLRLRVLVSALPYGEGSGFFTIAETTLNPLPPLGQYSNLMLTMPLASPPDGVYHLTIGIFEQENGCTAADGFCPDGAATFPSQVQVYGGVFYAYASDSTTTTVVEYYHAEFDHYFLTSSPDEVSKLDAGAFSGWARTGRTFGVWKVDTGSLAEVCRFFSTSFGTKSSHFYTPFGNECAIVRTNPDWQYEGVVAYFGLPAADGTCAIGLPLYRLYNNGMGGAPNHRYTTSLAVRDQMMRAGWIPEGAGIGVIACAPY